MIFNAKEADLKISTGNVHYITFGKGNKPLVKDFNRRIYEFFKKEN